MVDEKFPGGLAAYKKEHFDFCADHTLTRVGFMNQMDCMRFMEFLQKHGFNLAEDIAIVDQFTGICHGRDWLEFQRHPEGYSSCWLKGQEPGCLATPMGWNINQSLGFFRIG